MVRPLERDRHYSADLVHWLGGIGATVLLRRYVRLLHAQKQQKAAAPGDRSVNKRPRFIPN